jgi:DNA repair photolyase
MAPILPGLSDDPRGMADVVRAAREAGATGVWANLLYLKPGTKEHFLQALANDWPELVPEYERLYGGRPISRRRTRSRRGSAPDGSHASTGFATGVA